jgi:hypothetical protein
VLLVRRVKNGTPSTHPLLGDELRALRRLQRESPSLPFVFVSERSTPFTTADFARMIGRAVRRGLGLELKAHRTCSVMPAVMRSPTRGMTRGQSKDGSAIGRLHRPRSIQRRRRIGSGISGASDATASVKVLSIGLASDVSGVEHTNERAAARLTA